MVCYVVLFILLVLLRMHFKRQNKKKAEFLASREDAQDQQGAHAFDDLT